MSSLEVVPIKPSSEFMATVRIKGLRPQSSKPDSNSLNPRETEKAGKVGSILEIPISI